MPHYRDGSEAVVGDVVKGRGYNVPHEITGSVVAVQPGSDHCNLTVACITASSRIDRREDGTVHVQATIEYGEASNFEKVG